MPAATAPSPRTRRPGAGEPLVVEVRPRWVYRMPRRGGPDGVSRVRGGVYERFLRIEGRGVVVRAWQRRGEERVAIGATPWPTAGTERDPATAEQLELAIARVRHALGVDDDLSAFCRRFRRDSLLGRTIRRMPWLRARRAVWPWEALAWAVTEQLIEVARAGAIQRRMTRAWGVATELPPDARVLWDVPSASELAARAPAELAALDLAPKRALALTKIAREVAAGRCDPDRGEDDRRLLAIPEIGPWTVRCLALKGRGDLDALPAGDLAYVKLVGVLAGLGRRATVEEVEEYFAPYAPYRGLAGLFALIGSTERMRKSPPLRVASS